MRGRVMSLYAIAFLGTTPIGAPLIGVIVAATQSARRHRRGLGHWRSSTGLGLVISHRHDERNVAELRRDSDRLRLGLLRQARGRARQ